MFKFNYSPSYQLPAEVTYFKQEMMREILCIPDGKPDIEQVMDTLVWPEVISYRLVETDEGLSNEGQNLSGLKLVVKLKLKEKVTYVADRCDQPVHGAHFETIKSVFVVVPEKIDGQDTCTLIKRKKLQVIPHIEAVEFRQLDKRCIYKCVMLLVEAKLK